MSGSEVNHNEEEEAKRMSAVRGWGEKKEQRNLYVI